MYPLWLSGMVHRQPASSGGKHHTVSRYLLCRGRPGCCRCRMGRTFCCRGGWREAEPQLDSSSAGGDHAHRSAGRNNMNRLNHCYGRVRTHVHCSIETSGTYLHTPNPQTHISGWMVEHTFIWASTFFVTVSTSPWNPQHPNNNPSDLDNQTWISMNDASKGTQTIQRCHIQLVGLGQVSGVYLEAFTETGV